MGGNDEREQTLNQLLAEMDGFDAKKGVVILGATNRPESLDPALLRPGRFDRRVPVQLPDLQGRVAILKVHAKDVHLDSDVDFLPIARATSGASGAELANMINEAALRAVRMGRERVTQADLEESVETVIAVIREKMRLCQKKSEELFLIMRSVMRWLRRSRVIQRRLLRLRLFRGRQERWDIPCR